MIVGLWVPEDAPVTCKRVDATDVWAPVYLENIEGIVAVIPDEPLLNPLALEQVNTYSEDEFHGARRTSNREPYRHAVFLYWIFTARPAWFVLLAETGRHFQTMLYSLRQSGYEPVFSKGDQGWFAFANRSRTSDRTTPANLAALIKEVSR